MKAHFTRKNFIVLALIFFYLLVTGFVATAIDANNVIMKEGNPIQLITTAFGFQLVKVILPNVITYVMLAVYTFLFAAALIYEIQLAKISNERPLSLKWIGIYLVTFLVCYGLATAIGIVSSLPINTEILAASYLYSLEAFLIGLIIYIILALVITFVFVLILNIKNYGKPFKLLSKNANKDMEEEKLKESIDELRQEEQGLLASSFSKPSKEISNNAHVTNAQTHSETAPAIEDSSNLAPKERVFPSLCSIDVKEEIVEQEDFENNIDLSSLCTKFRNYLAKEQGLYFSIDVIRQFVSALSASRLLILEGLSGTGKSSLARYFSSFISEKSFFAPVQATWRDRTSLLGFYNDFSKSYNETEFLKRLYEASYHQRDINIMVLDEMNISRVEYYFADFLSIMEYPEDEWVLKIMQLPYNFEAPNHLEDGNLAISNTTWFIGTANKDDSTYTITDKVYDRAIVISFNERNESFEVKEDVKPISISYDYLMELFTKAQNKKENRLSSTDLKKLTTISDFIFNSFDITFGNRIMHQIELFTPVFVECGGTKEDALDFIISRKVLNKLEGRFEDSIKPNLEELLALIDKTYGFNNFNESKKVIRRLLKRF